MHMQTDGARMRMKHTCLYAVLCDVVLCIWMGWIDGWVDGRVEGRTDGYRDKCVWYILGASQRASRLSPRSTLIRSTWDARTSAPYIVIILYDLRYINCIVIIYTIYIYIYIYTHMYILFDTILFEYYLSYHIIRSTWDARTSAPRAIYQIRSLNINFRNPLPQK